MAVVIPLQAVPSQTLTAQLGGQPSRINVYQKSTGLFLDLYLNDVLIVGGVLCHNLDRLVRAAYLGFVGELAFMDLEGSEDPTSAGLGARYVLLYLP